eukprot:3047659-Prymnesium_polylepis.1
MPCVDMRPHGGTQHGLLCFMTCATCLCVLDFGVHCVVYASPWTYTGHKSKHNIGDFEATSRHLVLADHTALNPATRRVPLTSFR